MDLQQLRTKMEKIKTDIARQEGEKTAVMSDLEKEFKIKSLDEAYNKYVSKSRSKTRRQIKTN